MTLTDVRRTSVTRFLRPRREPLDEAFFPFGVGGALPAWLVVLAATIGSAGGDTDGTGESDARRGIRDVGDASGE